MCVCVCVCVCVCLSVCLSLSTRTHARARKHVSTHRADSATHLCFEALARSQFSSAAKPHCNMQLIVESLLSPIIFAERSEFFG